MGTRRRVAPRGIVAQRPAYPRAPPPAPIPDHGLALLVDGDNVPPQLLEPLVLHLESLGRVTERRIFRNWRSHRDAQAWDLAAQRMAFERIDRYRTTEGKNGSDIAVAVSAMDLFHGGYRRFCLASGDTDFAPLVERLRRGGAHVIWVGHKVDGGLLADLADSYMDWKGLMPSDPGIAGRGRSTPAGARQPGGRSPRPARSGKPASPGPDGPRSPAASRGAKPETGRAGSAPAKGAPRPRSLPSGHGRTGTPSPPPRGRAPPGKPAGAPGPARPAGPSRSPASRPARPASPRVGAPELPTALLGALVDAFEVARTDGLVDEQGWLMVDVLGQVARSVVPDFSPAKYGLGARTSLSRILARAPGFEIQPTGKGKQRQYRVRRTSQAL